MAFNSFFAAAASRDGGTIARRAAEWLSLGAAPAFAIMALLTGIHGGGVAGMPGMAMRDPSPLQGMVPMYVLMGVFHLPPWLKCVGRRGSASPSQPQHCS